jgi:hypothetical protein
MNQGAFGLADDAFWTADTAIEEQLLDRFESDESFAGIVLDGPREVRLDRCNTLPLLVVRACTLVDNATLDLDSRGILIATRLEGHETLVDFAFRQPTLPPDDDTTDGTDVDQIPEGRTVKVHSLSLTERLREFPWKPGTWQTTLLLFDQRSNPVVTHLGEAPSRDPAVAEFLAAQRRPGYPQAVSMPGGPATNLYRPRLDTPPPPAGPGFTLAVEPVTVDRPGESCMLRGSFLLPLLPRDVIRPLPGPPGSQAERQALADGWVEAGAPEAVAVVPITVLLTGDRDPTPVVLPLQAAVYGSIEGSLTQGQLAIDLFTAAPNLPAQRYAAWAISRGIISDPVRLHILNENP